MANVLPQLATDHSVTTKSPVPKKNKKIRKMTEWSINILQQFSVLQEERKVTAAVDKDYIELDLLNGFLMKQLFEK